MELRRSTRTSSILSNKTKLSVSKTAKPSGAKGIGRPRQNTEKEKGSLTEAVSVLNPATEFPVTSGDSSKCSVQHVESDITEADRSSSGIVPTLQKKRGRPKKKSQEDSKCVQSITDSPEKPQQFYDDQIQDDETVPNLVTLSASPGQHVVFSDIAEAEGSSLGIVPTLPRKRGRPKKQPRDESAFVQSIVNSPEKCRKLYDGQIIPDRETVPALVTMSVSPVELTEPEGSSTNVGVAKKRGRKRKVVTLTPELGTSSEINYLDGESTSSTTSGIRKRVTKTTSDSKRQTNTKESTKEPAICIRCGNIPAGMAHFFRLHNGLLEEEQKSAPLDIRNRQWRLTLKKNCRLRCQISDCNKILTSTTAMKYHEKTCGVAVEKKQCDICMRMVSLSYLAGHIKEHDRRNGIYVKKMYSKQIEPISTMIEETSVTIGSRRKSAIACKQKLMKLEKGTDDELDVDEDKYQISDRSSSEDSLEDIAVSSIDEDLDDDRKVGPSCGSARRQLISFVPTQKFPNLDTYWQEALKNVGFILCRVGKCRHLSLTYDDCKKHHNTCLRAEHCKDQVTCILCPKKRRLYKKSIIHHYIHKHEKSRTEACQLAEMKKPSPREAQLARLRPSQAEIDALRLFD